MTEDGGGGGTPEARAAIPRGQPTSAELVGGARQEADAAPGRAAQPETDAGLGGEALESVGPDGVADASERGAVDGPGDADKAERADMTIGTRLDLEDDLPEELEGGLTLVRRRVMGAALTLAVLALAVFILGAPGRVFGDDVLRYATPSLLALFTGLLALLAFVPKSLRLVSRATIVAGCLYDLVRLGASVAVADAPPPMQGEFVAALLILMFVQLSPRAAMQAAMSLSLAGIAVLVGAVFLATNPVASPEVVAGRLFGMPLIIVLLYVAAWVRVAHREAQIRADASESESRRDPLTGVPNRRGLDRFMEGHIAGPLSLVLLDIDDFKSVNDSFGHDAGDRVLTELAKIGTDTLRDSDLFGRWGGEEFVMVLPGAKAQDAARVADRVRQKIGAKDFGVDRRVTASFGVAFVEGAVDVGQLSKDADRALYQAKEAGKDQVVIAPERRITPRPTDTRPTETRPTDTRPIEARDD